MNTKKPARIEYTERRSMMNDLRKVNKLRQEAVNREKEEAENGLIEIIKRQKVPLERKIRKNLFIIKRKIERMGNNDQDIKEIQKMIEDLKNDFRMYKMSIIFNK